MTASATTRVKNAAWRYGRQGGRWVGDDAPTASKRVDQIHDIRLAAIARGFDDEDRPYWPQESIDMWREIADQARVRLDENLPLSPVEHRALDVDDAARKAGSVTAGHRETSSDGGPGSVDVDGPLLRQWRLEDLGRPMTMNDYRTLHHFARAAYDREVRNTFGWLAKQARIPKVSSIVVVAAPVYKRRPLPDVGACFPAAKAAIDGLVDAGVIPDDRSPFLAGLTFVPPEIAGRDALVLIVAEYPLNHEGDRS